MAEAAAAAAYDYVIVGGGTAGCVLANRLSADPSVSVLLIEAGGKDDWIWIRIPVGYLYCIDNPRTDWRFRTEAEPGLNGRVLNYPRGRVLGGCSSINGMIVMRGQAQDYAQWAAAADARWGWDAVLPLFLELEDHHAGNNALHGAGGDWRVEPQRLHWQILDAVRDAAVAAGIPASTDFNTGHNTGVGYFDVNQRRGVRVNAADAFLRPVRQRPNLQVVTGWTVDQLLFEGRRVVGVRAVVDGAERLVHARLETVLAAGSIGSPAILQRSGIGPAGRLRALGIAVRDDRPAVGADLQDHLQLRAVFAVQGARTLNTLVRSPWRKALMGLEYALKRSGPLAMAPSQLGIFARSDPAQARANVQFHVQPLSLARFGGELDPYPAITMSVCNLRPTSRGAVTLRSTDAHEAPHIQLGYLSTDEDRRVAVDSLRLARRIVAQAPLARFAPREVRPGAERLDEAALLQGAGEVGTSIFHPVGTCRMGRDEAAVVDPQLRVRGVAGLRVADASVMPNITSGNTNTPTAMIALQAAKLIAAARRRA
jgi:choline dehydrogenase